MGITFEAAAEAHRAGDLATAEAGYLQFPRSRNALYNLARIYRDTDRLAEAEAVFRRLLAHDPGFALAERGLAMALLAQRRYAQAWPHYEARRRIIELPTPPAGAPEWLGEPIEGRILLVLGEQGLGDQLMFARFIRALQARGARPLFRGDPRLASLFAGAGLEVRDADAPEPDAWTYACSLPLRLGLEAPGPPLRLPGGAGGGGIGVMARGNPAHQNDRNRSLDAAAAAELLRLGRDLAPDATGAQDMLATARIVADLDLVVSVDTAMAHLALALGTPCWLLAPRIGLDWRWNDGVRSDWYPQVRIFRQARAGDWSGPLDEVRAALDAEGLA